MAITIDSARGIFPNTLSADAVPALTARFNQLSAEDQLAWTNNKKSEKAPKHLSKLDKIIF